MSIAAGEKTLSKFLGKPQEKRCTDCAYCNRSQFHSGKWYCNHPDVHVGVPVDHDKPCFVRRGSVESAKREI